MRGLLGLSLLLAGCPTPVCDSTAAAYRCHEDRAEVCASDGQWQLIADCSSIEGARCAEDVVDDGHALSACVPTSGGEQ